MVIRIELVPTLDHCIETVARQEFLKSTDEYMQSTEANKKLEDKIELLRAFLETADFRKLRSESEKHLIEGKIVRFILTLDKGKLDYKMKVSRRFEIDSIVYGPVSSWRLGRSLGIDLFAGSSKICPFDCTYCEWGPTINHTSKRREFVSLDELKEEFEQAKGTAADYATFAGNGEPTLASNLGRAIELVKSTLKLPVAVLTNSSLMTGEDVRHELTHADLVVAKVDAPNEEIFQKINRPAAGLALQKIVQGIKSFRAEYKGRLALQMMFVDVNKDCAEGMARIAEELSPDEVQINTPLRPCNVRPLTSEEVAIIRAKFDGLKQVVTVYEALKSIR
ncbi:MAG TPA: radical SAM protein [Dehalococcoidia bacterium]|nr:radical SAM protein [Dehalococcoidia bacterium]